MTDTPISLSGQTARLDWPRYAPAFLALACFGILGIAFFVEYAFGYEPCSLCLYQRIAYGVGGAIAIAAQASGSRPRGRRALLVLAGIVLFVGSGIAFYHVGVEHHWWGSAFCAGGGNDLAGLSFEDLQGGLNLKAEKPCDIVDWTIFGQSPATWNVGLLLVFGLGALATARASEARRPAP